MMGVDNWQHWAAWFIVSFVSALLAVSFMTVLFCTEVRVRVPPHTLSGRKVAAERAVGLRLDRR